MLNPFQEVGHDRLSKFEYFPGDPNATRASEEILIDAEAGFNDIHSGGFCGFKPSDYGNTVSAHIHVPFYNSSARRKVRDFVRRFSA